MGPPTGSVEQPPAPGGTQFESGVGMPAVVPGHFAVPPPPPLVPNIPRVIPLEPLPGQIQGPPPAAARPKVIQLRRDATGLVPGARPARRRCDPTTRSRKMWTI